MRTTPEVRRKEKRSRKGEAWKEEVRKGLNADFSLCPAGTLGRGTLSKESEEGGAIPKGNMKVVII